MASTYVVYQRKGLDSYGAHSYTLDTPEQHRYKWPLRPIIIDDQHLALYKLHAVQDSTIAPIHNILKVAETMTTYEEIRVDLMEVFIGQILTEGDIVDTLHEIRTGNAQSKTLQRRCCYGLVNLAELTIIPEQVRPHSSQTP